MHRAGVILQHDFLHHALRDDTAQNDMSSEGDFFTKKRVKNGGIIGLTLYPIHDKKRVMKYVFFAVFVSDGFYVN